jgi:hypothetical protein
MTTTINRSNYCYFVLHPKSADLSTEDQKKMKLARGLIGGFTLGIGLAICGIVSVIQSSCNKAAKTQGVAQPILKPSIGAPEGIPLNFEEKITKFTNLFNKKFGLSNLSDVEVEFQSEGQTVKKVYDFGDLAHCNKAGFIEGLEEFIERNMKEFTSADLTVALTMTSSVSRRSENTMKTSLWQGPFNSSDQVQLNRNSRSNENFTIVQEPLPTFAINREDPLAPMLNKFMEKCAECIQAFEERGLTIDDINFDITSENATVNDLIPKRDSKQDYLNLLNYYYRIHQANHEPSFFQNAKLSVSVNQRDVNTIKTVSTFLSYSDGKLIGENLSPSYGETSNPTSNIHNFKF